MRARSIMIPALLIGLGGCQAGGVQARWDAAHDVRAFLQAARSGDRGAFEAHVDRPALRAELRQALLRAHPGGANDEVRSVLAGPQGQAMLDRMIQPSNFSVRVKGGLSGGGAPNAASVALALRPAGQGRLCLPATPRAQACAMTFAREDGTWKLVAIDARDIRLTVHPAPLGPERKA